MSTTTFSRLANLYGPAPTARGFTITNPRKLNKSTLIGAFDLETPSGIIFRVAMPFEKNSKRWISFASKEWTGQDGVKKYEPIVEFASAEIREKCQAAVLPLAEAALR